MNFYKVNETEIINLDLVTKISRFLDMATVHFINECDNLRINEDECDKLEEYLFKGEKE